MRTITSRTALFIFALSVMLAGLSPVLAKAAETNNTNMKASLATSFDDAEAWNMIVKSSHELKNLQCRPIFSRDFRQLIYLDSVQIAKNSVINDFNLCLKVLSMENGSVVKTIKVSNKIPFFHLLLNIALSPDGRKIVCHPVDCLFGPSTNMLFIDLDTSKIIGVKIDNSISLSCMLYWPNSTNIDMLHVRNQYRINLDTLDFSPLPDNVREAESATFNVQTHKNCIFDPNYWSVTSRNHPYTHVLISGILSDRGESLPNIWSPDLRYILMTEYKTENSANTALLIKLGLRSTPILDFEINGLAKRVNSEHSQLLRKAFTDKKRIWANIYGAKINALNDKVVGPDEELYKGQGFLTQIEPTFKFTFTYEIQPAAIGDVLAVLHEDGWKWDSHIWGQLVTVGEGELSGIGR